MRISLLAAILLVLFPASLSAEKLVATLSSDEVRISSNFSGTTISVFGIIQRDRQSVARGSPYDIAVVIEGPPRTLVTRKKERLFGIWLNAKSARFPGVPSYYQLLTTRDLDNFTTDITRARYRLGGENVLLSGGTGDAENENFKEAFVRLQNDRQLYDYRPGGVSFLAERAFNAEISVPAVVATGRYQVRILLFRDTALLDSTVSEIVVSKTGFEEFVTRNALERSFFYGLACVAVAIGVGWLGGVVFRRG